MPLPPIKKSFLRLWMCRSPFNNMRDWLTFHWVHAEHDIESKCITGKRYNTEFITTVQCPCRTDGSLFVWSSSPLPWCPGTRPVLWGIVDAWGKGGMCGGLEGRGGIERGVWLRKTRKRGTMCNRKEMMKMKELAHPFGEEVYYLWSIALADLSILQTRWVGLLQLRMWHYLTSNIISAWPRTRTRLTVILLHVFWINNDES